MTQTLDFPSTRHLVIKSHAGAGGLAMQTQDVPALGPRDVLVRVRQSAICGTDLHLYKWNDWAARNYKPPMPLGHEFAGEVIQVGGAVEHIKLGQHVAGETHLSCGACRQCRLNRRHTCENLRLFSKLDVGCFSDYLVVPDQVLRPVHPELPYSKAAIMEPFGVGVRAAMEVDLRGQNLLVVGCGPIGLYTIAAARHLGATTIIAADPSAYRRKLALAVGATAEVDPTTTPLGGAVREITRGENADVAIDASGSIKAIQDALACLVAGGKLVLVGVPSEPVPIDVSRHVINREIKIQGTYGRLIDETWLTAERLMLSGQLNLDAIVTHTLPLDRFQEAFDLAASGNAGKVTFSS